LIFQQIHAFIIFKKWGTRHVQGHEVCRKYDTLFDILKVVKVVTKTWLNTYLQPIKQTSHLEHRLEQVPCWLGGLGAGATLHSSVVT
jgi:hypothetical protein